MQIKYSSGLCIYIHKANIGVTNQCEQGSMIKRVVFAYLRTAVSKANVMRLKMSKSAVKIKKRNKSHQM